MIVEKLEEVAEKLREAKVEAEKVQTGNASAARRLRKICMEASKDLKDLRSLILEHSKK